MRKIIAIILSGAALYGIFLLPRVTKEAPANRTVTYAGVNYQALENLKTELNKKPQSLEVQNLLGQISEEQSIEYRGHTQESKQDPYMIATYLAGLIVGIFGFASLRNEKVSEKKSHEGVVTSSPFKQTNVFTGFNHLVAENTSKMNPLFSHSNKLIDVDYDENLSECFIEANHLDAAIKEFIMAGYDLIKDEKKAEGLYLRTSEKGQRFNLNCFIPALTKESFAKNDSSKIFIDRLSTLESKFNLYYPRISFRWIHTSEMSGVDICISLENKSELESIFRETNA